MRRIIPDHVINFLAHIRCRKCGSVMDNDDCVWLRCPNCKEWLH